MSALARCQRVVVSAWAPAAFAPAAARLLLFLIVACNLEPATVFQQYLVVRDFACGRAVHE